MDPRIYTTPVDVICPLSSGRKYTVYVRYMLGEDGKPCISMSNGCDNMSGASDCIRCALLVRRYFEGKDFDGIDFSGFQIG